MKYFAEIKYGQEPKKATEGLAGYDVFAAEPRTILPGENALACLVLCWAIPKGFCGRILSCSSLIRESNITVEGGQIDSDFRSVVNVILFNHLKKVFTLRTGERLAQVVFLQKVDVDFEKVIKVADLEATSRADGGFGLIGKTVIKKMKFEEEEDSSAITFEEAILSVANKVILPEKDEK